jgi:hypothetical protein
MSPARPSVRLPTLLAPLLAALALPAAADPLHLATVWGSGVGDPPYAGYPAQGGTITNNASICAHVGQPMAVQLTGAGGVPPYSFHLGVNSGTPGEFGALPSWVDFDPASGLIEISAPDASQVVPLRMMVSDSDTPPAFHPTGGYALPHSGTPGHPILRGWRLQVALELPTSVFAGQTFTLRNIVSISGCNTQSTVVWSTLTTLPDEDFGQDESAQFISATNGGSFTLTGTTVAGIAIPPRSVFWNLGSRSAGQSFLLQATFLVPSGSLDGTRHQVQSFIGGRANVAISDTPQVAGTPGSVRVNAAPAPALALVAQEGTTLGHPPLALPGANLVLRLTAPPGGSNNGSIGGAFETLHEARAWLELAPLCALFELDEAECLSRIAPPALGGSLQPDFDPGDGNPVLAAVWPLGSIAPGSIILRDLIFEVPETSSAQEPVALTARLDSARSAPVGATLPLGVAAAFGAAEISIAAPATLDLGSTRVARFDITLDNTGSLPLDGGSLVLNWPEVQVDGLAERPSLFGLMTDPDVTVDDSALADGILRLDYPSLSAVSGRTLSIELELPACADAQLTALEADFSASAAGEPVTAQATRELQLVPLGDQGDLTLSHAPGSLFPPAEKNFVFTLRAAATAALAAPRLELSVDSLQIDGVAARPELVAINPSGEALIDSAAYASAGAIAIEFPDLAPGSQRQVTLRLGYPIGFVNNTVHTVGGSLTGQACGALSIARSANTLLLGQPALTLLNDASVPLSILPGEPLEFAFDVSAGGSVPATRGHVVVPLPAHSVFLGARSSGGAASLLCTAPPEDAGLPDLDDFGFIWTPAVIDSHFQPGTLDGDTWRCPQGEIASWVAFSLDDPGLDPAGLYPGQSRRLTLELRNDEVRDEPNLIDQPSPPGTAIAARGLVFSQELIAARSAAVTVTVLEDTPQHAFALGERSAAGASAITAGVDDLPGVALPAGAEGAVLVAIENQGRPDLRDLLVLLRLPEGLPFVGVEGGPEATSRVFYATTEAFPDIATPPPTDLSAVIGNGDLPDSIDAPGESIWLALDLDPPADPASVRWLAFYETGLASPFFHQGPSAILRAVAVANPGQPDCEDRPLAVPARIEVHALAAPGGPELPVEEGPPLSTDSEIVLLQGDVVAAFDLTLDGPSEVLTGSKEVLASFVATVHNPGSSDIVDPTVTLSWTQAAFESAIAPDGSVDAGNAGAGSVTVSFPSLAAGSSRTATLVLRVPPRCFDVAASVAASLSASSASGLPLAAVDSLNYAQRPADAGFSLQAPPRRVIDLGDPEAREQTFRFVLDNAGAGTVGLDLGFPTVFVWGRALDAGFTLFPELLDVRAGDDAEVNTLPEFAFAELTLPDLPGGSQREIEVDLRFPAAGVDVEVHQVEAGVSFSLLPCVTFDFRNVFAESDLLQGAARLESAASSKLTSVQPGAEVHFDYDWANAGSLPLQQAHMLLPVPERSVFLRAQAAPQRALLCSGPEAEGLLPPALDPDQPLTLADIVAAFLPAQETLDGWTCPQGEATRWLALALDDPQAEPPATAAGDLGTLRVHLRNDEVRDEPNEIDQPSLPGSLIEATVATLAGDLAMAIGEPASILIDAQPLSASCAMQRERVADGDITGGSVSAVGGLPPYQFALTAGALPPGLELGGDGAIFGVPTELGDFAWTVGVSDSLEAGANAECSLTVRDRRLFRDGYE